MPTPRKALNPNDPSGLRRTEDRRAREMRADLEQALKRVLEQASPHTSPAELQRIIDRELAAYNYATRAKLLDWLEDTGQRAVLRSEVMLDAAGVQVGARLGPRQLPPDLRERIEINVANELDSLQADARKVLTRSLTEGLEAGEGARTLAERIGGDMAMPLQRAELIARTETMRAYNDTAVAQYVRHDIERVEWLATKDARTCPTCGMLHGRRWPIEQAPPCPAHPRCRCVLLPVVSPESSQH